MSSTQSFTCTINTDNYSDYVSYSDSVVTFVYHSDYLAKIDTASSSGANIYFDTEATKKLLFPNATAHPTKLTIQSKHRRSGYFSGTAYLRFRVGGVDLGINAVSSSVKSDTETSEDLTSATITSMTSASSLSVNGYATAYALFLRWVRYILYFTRYDFSASAGSNVSSASVSSSTGYDGDTITYSCVLADGATFDGWYSGSTRVSTSQTYTHTVNGADVTLEARATMPVTTKTVSATYNGAQVSGFPKSTQSDVALTYGGASKGSIPISGGTKTFYCGGKIANSAIGIGGTTLNNSGKLMATDIVVTVS